MNYAKLSVSFYVRDEGDLDGAERRVSAQLPEDLRARCVMVERSRAEIPPFDADAMGLDAMKPREP